MRPVRVDTTTADWLDDPRLADYRLVRDPERVRRHGRFLAEGRRSVQTLLVHSSLEAHSVLVTEPALAWLETVPGVPDLDLPAYVLPPAAMRALAGHRFHQGCLASGERPPARAVREVLDGIAGRHGRVVALDGVTNPDNVGAIFRSAAALGVDAVLLGPDCCSPLYRKAIRTSMGTALTLPFSHGAPWAASLDAMRAHGYRLVALTPRPDAASLTDLVAQGAAREERLALLLGAEGTGLGARSLAAAHVHVHIEITTAVDSLNVAAAAAIALHALRPASGRR